MNVLKLFSIYTHFQITYVNEIMAILLSEASFKNISTNYLKFYLTTNVILGKPTLLGVIFKILKLKFGFARLIKIFTLSFEE